MHKFKVGDRVVSDFSGCTMTVQYVRDDNYIHCVDDDGNIVVRQADTFSPVLKWDGRLIGIAGRKGHGKDTAAQAISAENVKFAGALKAMIRTYMEYVGVSTDTIERAIEGDLKETPLACWGGRTTRHAMQTLGTEWGRNCLFERIWVDSFFSRADQFERVKCTDMRFPNEVTAVKSKGGLTLKIVDPRKPPSNDEHPSETLIDTLEVDYVIVNDGTIEELHEKVRSVIKHALGRKHG